VLQSEAKLRSSSTSVSASRPATSSRVLLAEPLPRACAGLRAVASITRLNIDVASAFYTVSSAADSCCCGVRLRLSVPISLRRLFPQQPERPPPASSRPQAALSPPVVTKFPRIFSAPFATPDGPGLIFSRLNHGRRQAPPPYAPRVRPKSDHARRPLPFLIKFHGCIMLAPLRCHACPSMSAPTTVVLSGFRCASPTPCTVLFFSALAKQSTLMKMIKFGTSLLSSGVDLYLSWSVHSICLAGSTRQPLQQQRPTSELTPRVSPAV
jgi:hypothetical protein